ncbi:MAG: hypothetical protein ACYSU8_08065 [Planctomycetota bacterium]|jgi:hypothetical protein
MSDPNTSQEHSNQPVIQFRCPNCRSVLRAQKKFAGKNVKCTQCGQLLQVPGVQSSEVNNIVCICGDCKTVFQINTDSEKPCRQKCLKCGYVFEIPDKDGQVSSTHELRFSCQACGQIFCALSKYGGKKIKCLKCHQPMTIPVPRSETEELKLVDPEPEILDDEPQERDFADAQSFGPEEIPAGPAGFQSSRPRGVSKKHAKNGEEKSVLAKLKIPLIAVAGVVGFIVGFLVVTSIIDKSSVEPDSIIVQSPEAIRFTEEVITQLAQKEVDSVMEHFIDDSVDDLPVRTVSLKAEPRDLLFNRRLPIPMDVSEKRK